MFSQVTRELMRQMWLIIYNENAQTHFPFSLYFHIIRRACQDISFFCLFSIFLLVLYRQQEEKSCAAARSAFYPDGAAMVFDQAARNRETEADAVCSGSVKWLEDALALIQRYARTGIADREFEPLPGIVSSILPHAATGNGQDASIMHSLNGVGKEVEQDLLHLGDIYTQGRDVGVEALHLHTSVSTLSLHEIEYVVAQCSKIAGNQMKLARTGKEEQVAHDTIQALHLFQDDSNGFLCFLVHCYRKRLLFVSCRLTGCKIIHEHLHGRFDRGERIANFVRHAGGHLAQRCKAVEAALLFFQPVYDSDIGERKQRTYLYVAVIAQRHDMHIQHKFLSVAPCDFNSSVLLLAAGQHLAHGIQHKKRL